MNKPSRFLAISVSLVLAGCGFLKTKLNGTINAPFVVNEITPKGGGVGTEVVIAGTGFDDKLTVLFKEVPVDIYKIEQGSRLILNVPAASAGMADIRVTRNDDTYNLSFMVTDGTKQEESGDQSVDGSDAEWQDKIAIGQFSIKAPSGTIGMTQPTVEWQGAANAQSYNVIVSSDAACKTAVRTFEGLATTEVTLTPALSAGSYFICVEAVNALGEVKSAANDGFGFAIDLSAPAAQLFGMPSATVSNPIITVFVGGLDVVQYRSKSGDAATTDCASEAGYSAPTAVTVPISIDHSGDADGTYKLCVVGINAIDGRQALANATNGTWTLDRAAPPALGAFTQIIPYQTGIIGIRLDMPAIVADYNTIEVFGAAGIVPPNCGSGDLLARITDFSTAAIVTKAWPPSSATGYSVRACIVDAARLMTSTDTLTDLKAKTQRLFVTSQAFDGNLAATFDGQNFTSGIDGADYRCQKLANDADLGGHWRAVLGTYAAGDLTSLGRSPSRWLPNYEDRVYNLDAKVVAEPNQLFGPALAAAVDFDETATQIASNFEVWSNVTSSGGVASTDDCSGWTSTAPSGGNGNASALGPNWVSDGTRACASLSRLYCLEAVEPKPPKLVSFSASGSDGSVAITIDFPDDPAEMSRVVIKRHALSAVVDNHNCDDTSDTTLVREYGPGFLPLNDDTFTDTTSFSHAKWMSYQVCVYDSAKTIVEVITETPIAGSEPSHRIFVTNASMSPNLGGLAGGDTVCNTTATAAGLAGTWKAILSDTSTNAADRINITGAVHNLMGHKVADDAADMWDNSLDAAILYTETGQSNYRSAMTGSDVNGQSSVNNCLDWTTSNFLQSSTVGWSDYVSGDFLYTYVSGCDFAHSLYCINGQ